MAARILMNGAFLINASRSGSTMMSTILRQHPDVLSLSELIATQGARALLPGGISGQAFWKQLSEPTALMRQLANPKTAPGEFLYHTVDERRFDPFNCPPILAVTLPHLFEDPDAVFDDLADIVPDLPRQNRADHMRAVINNLGEKTGRKFWVERSGGTLLATSALAHAFPEARFVVLLRDGRDVSLSMQNYKPARFVIWFWKLASRFGIDVFKPGTQIGSAGWIAMAEKLSGRALPMARILNTKPSIADAAACWSALTKSGLEQFRDIPNERRLVMRYEAVVADPKTELSRLSRFLALPKNSNWLEFGAGVPRAFPPRHTALPMSEQRALANLTEAARAESDQLV
ncbi:sulfotransferase [uncultured Ruegeria sp.]|uniref:sulfotransferase n=1 Tax=uncultured Ruegeria sp. TaxID=259304 RepID=UPI0026085EDF|nr:sulfotransferase [uncultured Ruegeria sp.]